MELKTYFTQDSYGNRLPYAECTIYLSGTTTLATGIEDPTDKPLSNPVSSGSAGVIQFAAPNGRYDLVVSKGALSYSLKVQCHDVTESIAEVEGVRDETGSLAIDALNYVGQSQISAIQAQQAVIDAGAAATAVLASKANVTDLASSTDSSKGGSIVGFGSTLEYPFDSSGYALHSGSGLTSGGNPQGFIRRDNTKFFDPLTRTTPATILPGSAVSIFDNNTTYGALWGTGNYTMESNGSTKNAGTGSAVLRF